MLSDVNNKISRDEIMTGAWRVAFLETPPLCLPVTFHPDGTLTGLKPEQGVAWRLDEHGQLFIADLATQTTITFQEMFLFEGEALGIGTYSQHDMEPTTVWLQRMTLAYSFLTNWTVYTLRSQIKAHGWKIGAYTYGTPVVIDDRMAKLEIGRFCSIAQNVSIALGHHRMDIVTTYPFQTLKSWMQDWPGASDVPDHGSKGDVKIGHDVWIASGVFIASGISVGHGAVIAAHSVVTKDVPPYALVAGNPAKIIRYRFDEATIEALLKLQWWDWSAEKVNRHLPLMIDADISRFLDVACRSDNHSQGNGQAQNRNPKQRTKKISRPRS